jgi:hypothetical protein
MDEPWIGRWSPGIGDPTFFGWLTVGLYFLTAWRCWSLVRQRSGALSAREITVYRLLAVALLILGVNKQLDLQSALTEIGRMVAKEEGLYEARRTLQGVFIFALGLLAAAACFVLIAFTRRLPWPTRGAVGGAILLVAFIAIRAASFHHFDHFIGLHWLGVRTNVVLEISAILLILVLSAYRRVTARVPPKPRVTIRSVPRAR